MRKKLLAVGMVLVLLVFAMPKPAQAVFTCHATFGPNSPTYWCEGYLYEMDVSPFIENGRIYIPLRFLAYGLGVHDNNIIWNEPTQEIFLSKSGYGEISLRVGSNTILRSNGSPIVMDVAPTVRDDRTFLPARYVAEAFGAEVYWSTETQTIQISWDDGQPLTVPDYSDGYYGPTPTPQPATEDDTPIPLYEWTYGGNQWSWDSGVTQRAVEIILDHYREMPHPHRNQLDYVLTYCTDEDSLYMIEALAKEITEIATREGIPRDEIPYLAIAFVQSFPYVSDSISSGYDEYPRYPIETFFERKGDCEDTAILTAVLLKQLGYGSALIILQNHCAVGVLGEEDIQGAYYLVNGKRYYYLETTDVGWEVGEVPDSLQGSDAIVLPLP